MSNVNDPKPTEAQEELDKVDWMSVSSKLTDTLRKILRDELQDKGSKLADQIADMSEINDFVSYDLDKELPPPLKGPLGDLEEILRKELFELLLKQGVSEKIASHTAPMFFQAPLRPHGEHCTTSRSNQGGCTIITRRCEYC